MADQQTDETRKRMRRRSMLAAAAGAVVGGIVAKTTQPVEATSTALTYATDTSGSPVNSPKSTIFIEDAPGFNTSPGNRVVTTQAFAHGLGSMYAISTDTYGVHGEIFSTDFTVFPYLPNTSPNTSAVEGVNQSNGNGGIAVSGVIPSTSSANATAVYGLNYSTYAGPGPGAGGFGVYGLSAKGHGLVGAVAAAGAAAVVGATNGVAGAYAGAFYGPVVVGGAFTVFGAKSAAVPHPDGTHRRLYCVESPESWFEDFGDGQLECGQADIRIDPDFAAVTALDNYHVFLTGYDGQYDLCVTGRTATGFRVQSKSGEASGQFSWRIVAKRKDIPAPRFEAVTVPVEPVLPPIPDSATRQAPLARMPPRSRAKVR
jgi:hypothetical protein